MISFRPHKILYTRTTEGSINDEGIFVEGVNELVDDNIPCRIESNGKAIIIALPDGGSYVYSYVVYLNNDVRDFNYGEIVQIQDNNGTIIVQSMEVKGFFRSQLNSKLYL